MHTTSLFGRLPQSGDGFAERPGDGGRILARIDLREGLQQEHAGEARPHARILHPQLLPLFAEEAVGHRMDVGDVLGDGGALAARPVGSGGAPASAHEAHEPAVGRLVRLPEAGDRKLPKADGGRRLGVDLREDRFAPAGDVAGEREQPQVVDRIDVPVDRIAGDAGFRRHGRGRKGVGARLAQKPFGSVDELRLDDLPVLAHGGRADLRHCHPPWITASSIIAARRNRTPRPRHRDDEGPGGHASLPGLAVHANAHASDFTHIGGEGDVPDPNA